jgi:hypothetical protein
MMYTSPPITLDPPEKYLLRFDRQEYQDSVKRYDIAVIFQNGR